MNKKTEFTWWWLRAKALACVPIPLRLAWILVLLFFCPAVKILKMAKSVYTQSALLKRAKIKYQTPCLCFSNTFVTRRVDESPLIFICTHSRWTADLLSQSYPTGTMVKLDVGGLQVSVWAAFTTLIREKVKYQEDLRHSGVCKVFFPTCQSEPTERWCVTDMSPEHSIKALKFRFSSFTICVMQCYLYYYSKNHRENFASLYSKKK